MSSSNELSGFIASGFRSVWALELLLLLKREPREWSREELVTGMRSSDLVVSQALESLVAAGLAATAGDKASYMPISPDVASLVDRAEELYAVKPDLVRRIIVTNANSGLAAFADAFRLRRD